MSGSFVSHKESLFNGELIKSTYNYSSQRKVSRENKSEIINLLAKIVVQRAEDICFQRQQETISFIN